ncbi:hypothetical protein ACF09C_25050 [Streptomyces sp. NPDC014870]|uniref:hypothetical protein n=1 Tax=Streptomyces sp. NPDC014870 TaxID=3364925 RepID=UPI0036FA6071
MDIPDWAVWAALGLSVLQGLSVATVVRRLRRADPEARTRARLDLLDTVGGLALFAGVMLTLLVADHWFWLTLVGAALIAAAYTVKGVLLLRARRTAQTGTPQGPSTR